MILAPQQANKILPLITNLDAYEAFQQLIEVLHTQAYEGVKSTAPYPGKDFYVGQLTLIDELKELRDRVKDSLHGRPEFN